jgi:hypothetical protein
VLEADLEQSIEERRAALDGLAPPECVNAETLE